MNTNISHLITSKLNSIVSSSVVDVEIDISPENENSLILICDEKYKSQIKINFSSGILKINAEGNFNKTENLKLLVKSSSLDEINIFGTSDVSGVYKGSDLKIKVSGTGDIDLSGEVDNLDLHISGTGDAILEKLKAKNVILKVSGTSDAKVFAFDSCNVTTSGTGDATIYGSPEIFQQKVFGLGGVKKVSNDKIVNRVEEKPSSSRLTASEILKAKIRKML